MGDVINFPKQPKADLHIDKTGKLKGSPHFRRETDVDFGDRMQRIKASLEKINDLMQELRKNPRKD